MSNTVLLQKICFSIFLSIFCFFSNAQYTPGIVWGPIMGATSSHSIRIAFKSKTANHYSIAMTDSSLVKQDFSFTTNIELTISGNIYYYNIKGLKADTRYIFNITSAHDTVRGSFKTFPEDGARGYFHFTFGSCNENYKDQSIFATMGKLQPRFFLHLGDWTYPDHEHYPDTVPGHNKLYSSNYDTAIRVYDVRYSLPVLKDFLRYTPVDFCYDDDDMTIDGCSRTTFTELTMKGKKCEMIEHPLPDSVRMHTINSYFASFPAYDMMHSHTEGAYHSYKCGNTEIFFLDTRADRSPDTEIFHKRKNDKWRLKISPTHNNLGDQQYQWLLNGLKNSTADWKIIASGTNFNVGYKKVLDLSMVLENYLLPNGMNGAYVAAMLSSEWCGYPYQERGILNFCHKNKIANVVVLSGDAHTGAIDDGKNSGFPECLSGNLAVDNSKQLDYTYNALDFNIWDKGGQGVNNTNYDNTLGNIEIFGRDSLRMSVIDTKGQTIVKHTVMPGFIPRHYSMRQGTSLTGIGKLRSIGYIFRILRKQKQKKKQALPGVSSNAN